MPRKPRTPPLRATPEADRYASLARILRLVRVLEHLGRGTSAHVLMREAFVEARVTAEIAYAGQSGTHWTEAATATIPSALAAALPDSTRGSETSAATGSDGNTPRR